MKAGWPVDKQTNRQTRQKLGKVTSHIVEAAVQRMEELSSRGDKWQWAHHKAVTAKGAWGWKVVVPGSPQLRLSDVEFAIAARLSFGLHPFSARAMGQMPDHCPLCVKRRTGEPESLRQEPWHWLTCSWLMKRELSRRHDAVVDATAQVAWQVGAQVQREVEDLDQDSMQRPDLQIVFPGRTLLVDVVVSHPLTAAAVAAGGSLATNATKSEEQEVCRCSIAAPGRAAEPVARNVRRYGERRGATGAGHRRGGREVERGHLEQRPHRADAAGLHSSSGAAGQCTRDADGLLADDEQAGCVGIRGESGEQDGGCERARRGVSAG